MQNSRLAGLRSATWVSVAAACLLLGVFLLFWRGAMPLEGLIREFARMDAGNEVSAGAFSPVTLRRYYSLSAGTAILIAGLLMLVWSVWARLNQETRSLLYGLAVTLATSCSLMIYLFRMKFEGPWMPISVVMRNPSALPIFGHRLLFVWIAKAVQSAVPSLSDVRSFYVSQGVAIVLTVYALGEWSAQHIGRAFNWIGQVIGIVMISTCFSYYNFYDIGTVFFTTCGVIAIYARRYWWLVPVVTVGTLNYEGVLLLIPLAAFAAYGQDPLRKWLPASAASVVGYLAVRYAMQAAIPFSRQVDWRIWSNMTEPFVYR